MLISGVGTSGLLVADYLVRQDSVGAPHLFQNCDVLPCSSPSQEMVAKGLIQ